MLKIESVGDLFKQKPSRWGLRGDRFLWEALRIDFLGVPIPAMASDVTRLVEDGFLRQVGAPMSSSDFLAVEKFARGGMSSGMVSPAFWRDTVVLLVLRRHKRYIEQQVSPNKVGGTNENLGTAMTGSSGNIFRLAEVAGDEDRFTASWACLLAHEPELVQAVADTLLEPLRTRPGLGWSEAEFKSATTVLGVTNHPSGYRSTMRPDFRIECAGMHVLVEHKLEAFLHAEQLENYLKMPHDVRTYLALVTPSTQPVPAEVLASERYLMPQDRNHFRWRDLYPAVRNCPGWLAQDFLNYMNHLGLSPFTLRGVEDIFDATRDVKDFRDALKAAATSVFSKVPGCVVMSSPAGLGCQIRKPGAGVSLIYAEAERAPAWRGSGIGPALAIYVYETDAPNESLAEVNLATALSNIEVQRIHIKPLKQGEGTAIVCYLAPLEKLLEDAQADTRLRIADVLRLVREDFGLNQPPRYLE